MIIECPECGTKNTTDRPLQHGKRYRCGKCGEVITFLQTTDAPVETASIPDKNSVYETSPVALKARKGQNWSDLLKPDGRFSRIQYVLILFVANIIMFPLVYLFQDAWFILIFIQIFVSYVAIIAGIRRLHDLNKSGWHLLFLLVPFANIVFLLYLLFAPGKIEGNRWA